MLSLTVLLFLAPAQVASGADAIVQAVGQVAASSQNPSTTSVPPAQVAPPADPAVPSASKSDPKVQVSQDNPEVVAYSGRRRPRIDRVKPYMRVWYWPPSPQIEDSGTGPVMVSNSVVTAGDTRPAADPIHFATASTAVLNDKGNQHQLVAWLKANPQRAITVDGHADVRGSQSFNADLARRRAEAVKACLVQQGVSSDQIKVESHGALNPLKAGTNEESWWLSRRVEIRVLNAGQ